MTDPSGLSAKRLLVQIINREELDVRLRQNIEANYESKKADLNALAVKVRAGESTGDRVIDFLALHPSLMAMSNITIEATAQHLRNLSEAISTHKNEPILIVRRDVRERQGFGQKQYVSDPNMICEGLMPPPSREYTHYTVDFGILDNESELYFGPVGNEFNDELRQYFLGETAAVAAFISLSNWFRLESGKSHFEHSPDVVMIGAGRDKSIPISLANLLNSMRYSKLVEAWQIIVGREAVEKWLTEDCGCFEVRERLRGWLNSSVVI